VSSCASNTNDYVTARARASDGRTQIIVTICKSTCQLFYNNCKEFALSKGYTKATDFCANYTHGDLFEFDDDEDYDDDVVYRVAPNDRGCFIGEGIISDLQPVERQIGKCLPPLGYEPES
jgi:hypothetical protein